MAQNNKTEKSTYNYYEKKLSDFTYPRISELGSSSVRGFRDRNVYAIEKMRGKHMRFIFEDGKVFPAEKYYKLNKGDYFYGAWEVFTEKFEASFASLVKCFNRVPFILFTEIISQKTENGIKYLNSKDLRFVCYDIYINSNWLNWDDLRDVLKENNFEIPPLLYFGKFDEEALRCLANIKSIYAQDEQQDIEGVVIRPTVEDDFYTSGRVICKITNNKFLKKEAKKESTSITRTAKTYKEIVQELLKKISSDPSFETFLQHLLQENAVSEKEEWSDYEEEVVKYLASEVIDTLEDEIAIEAAANSLSACLIRNNLEKPLRAKIKKLIY